MTQRVRWWRLLRMSIVSVVLITATFARADHHEKKDGSAGTLRDAALHATTLQVVIAGSHRSEADRARDKYRHPQETLTFFGVKDNMTVVEIWPGDGWYTDILAPLLKEKGTYYAAGIDPQSENEGRRTRAQKYQAKLTANPALFDKVKLTILDPPAKVDVAPEGSADMVLTFRNVHNWMAGEHADVVFKAMFKALKSGGVLGVVEHRGNPTAPQDPKAASGYVREDVVIKLAEDAGFKLEGKSEINANPKDTKDYEQGVWTLPPVLRLKEVDKEKYLAIGESDRMTLKFVKPTGK